MTIRQGHFAKGGSVLEKIAVGKFLHFGLRGAALINEMQFFKVREAVVDSRDVPELVWMQTKHQAPPALRMLCKQRH